MDVTYALDLDAPAIGFRRLSSNRFLNLQANRWLVTERAVADFLPVVPRTTRIADWVRTYLDLADRVRDQEHDLEAAFFARGAEFFMQPGNPLKAPTRRPSSCALRQPSPRPTSPPGSPGTFCSCRAPRTSSCRSTRWFVRPSVSPPPAR